MTHKYMQDLQGLLRAKTKVSQGSSWEVSCFNTCFMWKRTPHSHPWCNSVQLHNQLIEVKIWSCWNDRGCYLNLISMAFTSVNVRAIWVEWSQNPETTALQINLNKPEMCSEAEWHSALSASITICLCYWLLLIINVR